MVVLVLVLVAVVVICWLVGKCYFFILIYSPGFANAGGACNVYQFSNNLEKCTFSLHLRGQSIIMIFGLVRFSSVWLWFDISAWNSFFFHLIVSGADNQVKIEMAQPDRANQKCYISCCLSQESPPRFTQNIFMYFRFKKNRFFFEGFFRIVTGVENLN